jgi:hypothetical protein
MTDDAGVVLGAVDLAAGGYLVLHHRQVAVDVLEGLQRGHRRGVRENARHEGFLLFNPLRSDVPSVFDSSYASWPRPDA